MNEAEIEVLDETSRWPGEEVPLGAENDPKVLYRQTTEVLGKDYLQLNFGRIQQFEKESYIGRERIHGIHTNRLVQRWIIEDRAQSITPSEVEKIVEMLISSDAQTVTAVESAFWNRWRNRAISINAGGMIARLFALVSGDPVCSVEQSESVRGKAHLLERARVLELSGFVDKALDLVYASIDQMLRTGRFSGVDELLNSIRVDQHSTDVLLTILTATFAAKSRLPSRSNFFSQTRELLSMRGENVNSVLVGLD